jgi:PAS domain S-box-containing protein
MRLDLTRLPWQVKAGFEPEDASGFLGGHTVDRFPLVPSRHADDPATGPYAFTVQTSFPLPAGANAPYAIPVGIFFSGIGERFTLYLNGRLVASTSDSPGHEAVSRNLALALPAEFLRAGENRLVIRFEGTRPGFSFLENPALGLPNSSGYWLGAYPDLVGEQIEYTAIFTTAFYLLLGLLGLALSFFVDDRKVILAFASLALSFSIYFGSRSGFVLAWITQGGLLRRLDNIALYSAGFSLALFLSYFLLNRKSVPHTLRTYAVFAGLCITGAALLPLPWLLPVLRLFQLVSAGLILWVVFRLFTRRWKIDPEAGAAVPGFFLLLLASAWDLINSVWRLSALRLASFGFLGFILALAIALARRFLAAHREAERLNAELRDREARFQSLYHATLEAICIREGNLVLEANRAFLELFGYQAGEVQGMPFTHFFTAETQAKVAAGLATGYETYAASGLNKAGQSFETELMNKPLHYEGRAVQVTAVRDITAQKLANQRLLARNAELEQMTSRMVERELRMVELKRQIEALKPAE